MTITPEIKLGMAVAAAVYGLGVITGWLLL